VPEDPEHSIFIGHTGVASDTHLIRIGTPFDDMANGDPADDIGQDSTFIAGIFGASVDDASDVPVLIDTNGQLGTMTSSRRFKKDIRDMASASERLLDLRPVSFRLKRSEGSIEGALRFGLIAEEVAEVFPELVVYDDEDQPYTVRYHLLSSLLLNELQKQHRWNQEQAMEIRRLTARLDPWRVRSRL
jgi:hypothetical protein